MLQRIERERKQNIAFNTRLVTPWALTRAACVLAEGAAEVDGPPEGRQRQCLHLPLMTQQSKDFD